MRTRIRAWWVCRLFAVSSSAWQAPQETRQGRPSSHHTQECAESLRVTTSVRSRSRSRSFALKNHHSDGGAVSQSVTVFHGPAPRARTPPSALRPAPPERAGTAAPGLTTSSRNGFPCSNWAGFGRLGEVAVRGNLTAQRFPCAVFAERTALENGGKSSARRPARGTCGCGCARFSKCHSFARRRDRDRGPVRNDVSSDV